ncbi:hypothetical protein [Salinarimonas ramus]|uniref:Uncharacterized protein n=1 Tax=Salinarimonas ramus TaxID=690164 RepID=A0A917V2R2_9HYPH|nr:hypothetical protein [Salinarimonas ramus]GGK26285.1 hypothetical protein GCM10011322_10830 [Salinarimonas ramus]
MPSMSTTARRPGLLRTTIAVVALYALVLGGLLGGLSSALALSTQSPLGGATVWCPVDGSMPADDPRDPCLHACRLGTGPGGPLLTPGPAPSLVARVAAPLVRAPVQFETTCPRTAKAPVGARAPPLS